MRSIHEHKHLEGESFRELRLLEEVARTPDVSQRRLAHQLGIALGVTNVLLKGLVRRGYIRVVQVRWRRWVYVLTPAGIARKIQLTFAYIERFLDHYRRVRKLIHEDLGALSLTAESRIAIYGTTELAELVYLVLRDLGVTNVEMIDDNPSTAIFLGMPVKKLASACPGEYAKVLVAIPGDTELCRRQLEAHGVCPSQIVTLLSNGSPVTGYPAQPQGASE